jgi:NADH:ubiquinone oxidoreductase subunit 4 (subunit M)
MDIKKIIAYSSISHMNLAILALFSNTLEGLEISIYFMISHGILSSGLFLLIGILYDRYHTRIISYFKGLVLLLPLYSLFFLLFTLGNIAFPLTSGFFSEIITFVALIITNPYVGILASFAIILTPAYALYLLHLILYGNWSTHLIPTSDLSRIEFSLLFPLAFSTIFIGIYPNIILSSQVCGNMLF